MRNVYLSFLGTNDYLTCTYYREDMPPVENVRFVQEATLGAYCREWKETDRGFIFVTKDAEKTNWRNNGIEKRVKDGKDCEGLESRISKLDLPFPVEMVRIPEGFTEEQLWKIFKIVFDRLEPEDNVVFDITHAFRSIPTLAVVVLNYARVLKNITIQGIYYGAFEALGPAWEVRTKPLEERKAEVLDLTSLETLLSWSGAIDGFLKSGNARQIKSLASSEFGPIRKNDPDLRGAAVSFQRLADSISDFGDTIFTCRGPALPSAAIRVQEKLTEVREVLESSEGTSLGGAFQPLFDHVRNEIKVFPNAKINGGIEAARWCLEHDLIQQGYTILQETLITHFTKKIEGDPLDNNARDLVNSAAKIVQENLPETEWKGESTKPENRNNLNILLGIFRENDSLVKMISRLSQERNDLNHAGYSKNSRNSKKFFANLGKHLQEIERFLSRETP